MKDIENSVFVTTDSTDAAMRLIKAILEMEDGSGISVSILTKPSDQNLTEGTSDD